MSDVGYMPGAESSVALSHSQYYQGLESALALQTERDQRHKEWQENKVLRDATHKVVDLVVNPSNYKNPECKEAPELFFSQFGENEDSRRMREGRARQLCRVCEHREQCLEWALKNNERQGVWGGTGEKERQNIAEERRGFRR